MGATLWLMKLGHRKSARVVVAAVVVAVAAVVLAAALVTVVEDTTDTKLSAHKTPVFSNADGGFV